MQTCTCRLRLDGKLNCSTASWLPIANIVAVLVLLVHTGQSKLANVLFTYELAKRLPPSITANALHPGIVRTELARYLVTDPDTLVGKVLTAVMTPFTLSPEQVRGGRPCLCGGFAGSGDPYWWHKHVVSGLNMIAWRVCMASSQTVVLAQQWECTVDLCFTWQTERGRRGT